MCRPDWLEASATIHLQILSLGPKMAVKGHSRNAECVLNATVATADISRRRMMQVAQESTLSVIMSDNTGTPLELVQGRQVRSMIDTHAYHAGVTCIMQV